MSDNRARIWFATFVLVVFCLGGVIGFRVGTHMPMSRPGGSGPGMFSRGGGPGRGGPPFGRGQMPPLPPELVGELSRELELDAAQQDQVKKILEQRRDRFDQVHRDAQARFEQEQRDLHAAIRGVLREDQQQRFEQFLDSRRGRGRGGRR